jgi:hypothetical protein
MFVAVDATALSPWDDFGFAVQYYGLLLSLTAVLVAANVTFLTAVLSEGSAWSRFKLALWQALLAAGGLGIGAGLPYGQHALLRLGELVHRTAH